MSQGLKETEMMNLHGNVEAGLDDKYKPMVNKIQAKNKPDTKICPEKKKKVNLVKCIVAFKNNIQYIFIFKPVHQSLILHLFLSEAVHIQYISQSRKV